MTPTSKGPLLDTEEESQVGKQKKEEEGLEHRRRERVKLENRKKRKKV